MKDNPEKSNARKSHGSLTISDIAKMAKVGVATVSRVLNGSPKVSPKTTARVKIILKKTNYRPAYAARALAMGRTNTIELLYNTSAEKLSDDPVLLSILDAIHSETRRAGYRLAFQAIKTEFETVPSRFLQAVEHRMADAGLIVTAKMTDDALNRMKGLPIVLLDQHGKGCITSVMNNNLRASAEAVEVLVSKGHRRIAFIWTGNNDYNEISRFEGFNEAVKRLGLSHKPDWTMTFKDMPGSLENAISGQDRPTAVITTWTTIIPVVLEIFEKNRLETPRDISLLTVDTAPGVAPSLTGLIRPVSGHVLRWDSVVKTAMDEIFSIIRRGITVRHIELPLPFHDAGTLGPPPA